MWCSYSFCSLAVWEPSLRFMGQAKNTQSSGWRFLLGEDSGSSEHSQHQDVPYVKPNRRTLAPNGSTAPYRKNMTVTKALRRCAPYIQHPHIRQRITLLASFQPKANQVNGWIDDIQVTCPDPDPVDRPDTEEFRQLTAALNVVKVAQRKLDVSWLKHGFAVVRHENPASIDLVRLMDTQERYRKVARYLSAVRDYLLWRHAAVSVLAAQMPLILPDLASIVKSYL